MEDLLADVRSMECGWNAGRNPPAVASGICRSRCDRRATVVHRRHDGARSSLQHRWRKKGDPQEPDDHALGRSRGGFTTKIHILCDANGLPLHFHLTAGQTHESSVLDELLVAADDSLRDDDGERIAWPFALGGDKGYRADWIDEYLIELGICPVIPSKKNEDRTARPVEFDKTAYRRRNIVERLIGWLKESRRIFSRYEKTAKNFGGMITLAFIRQYLQYELI